MTSKLTIFTALFVHLFLSLIRPINDPDIWWHLRAGQYVAHNGIPRSDFFSFTNFGREWVAHEWLSEGVMYLVHSVAWWQGLIVLSSLITAVVFLWVAWQAQARALLVFIVAAGAQAASLPVLRDPRPRLASFVLTAVFFVLLRKYTTTGESRGALYALPFLMVLWVNLHAGYPLGILLLGLAIGAVVIKRDTQKLRPLVFVLAGCILAIACSPYGVRMFGYPFETVFSPVQRAVITEWASPDFHDPQARALQLLLIATVAVLAISKLRTKPFDLLCLLVALSMTLSSERHVTLLSLVAVPLLSEQLHGLWPGNEPTRRTAPMLLLLVVTALNLPAVVGAWRSSVNLESKPVQAITFLEQNKLPDNVFSRYEWNDYLIWATERKVFIDGRPDMYGDQFVARYLQVYAGNEWQAAFDQFKVQTALVQPGSGIAKELGHAGWVERYRDDQAVIFTRASD